MAGVFWFEIGSGLEKRAALRSASPPPLLGMGEVWYRSREKFLFQLAEWCFSMYKLYKKINFYDNNCEIFESTIIFQQPPYRKEMYVNSLIYVSIILALISAALILNCSIIFARSLFIIFRTSFRSRSPSGGCHFQRQNYKRKHITTVKIAKIKWFLMTPHE